MNFDPQKHHRRSIRLKEYDYSQPGWYFITLCTNNREMLFGDVIAGKMVLNDAGVFTTECWRDIPGHYPDVCLDEFIIMSNHVHGIINISENDENRNAGAKNVRVQNVRVQNFEPLQNHGNKYQKIIPRSIGSIIRGFKISVTKWFRQNTDIYTVWQRNYYEHIIRNEPELNRIRQYIIENQIQWQNDKYFPRDE